MDPALLFIGGFAGLIAALSISDQQPSGCGCGCRGRCGCGMRRKACGCPGPCACPMGAPGFAPPGVDIGLPPTGAAVDPKVAEALQTFLPATAQNIEAVVASDPQTALDWRAMAARMPYLSEAVAMYYTMADPNTSSRPKLIIAGALLYLISPWDVIPDAIPGLGQLDDAGVLLGALAYVYDMMTPRHLEQAQAWLRSQGIDPKPLFAIGKEFTEEEIIAAEQVSNKIKMLPAPSAAAPVAPDAQPAAPFQGW